MAICTLEIVFVVVIYCYHGDGSDGSMCVQSTKYHGFTQATMLEIVVIVTMAMVVIGGMCVQIITAIHMYYYQQLMLETVFYSLLFVVGGERIAMAMVLVGHIHKISWSYTT